DAELYVSTIMDSIALMIDKKIITQTDTEQIIFTGQAESLVLLDAEDKCLMNAISWLDERSIEESKEIASHFPVSEWYSKTGQQAVLPTWPATKVLWLRKHKPEIFSKVASFMMLKDFVAFRFCGKKAADCSIATFSCYFDIFGKVYWKEMLEYLQITELQLPPLVEPGTVLGTLTKEAKHRSGLSCDTSINIGTLDHFAGMIGCGNVKEGSVSYSTGTVMALATIANPFSYHNSTISMHYGFLPDTYVMLPVAESGGICLQWFRDRFLPNSSFRDIDSEIVKRGSFNDIVFLPYLVGTNAPEFEVQASGLFWNLRFKHDAYDMAYAVMEGVAHLLKKNCDEIRANNTRIDRIIATGGGAKSSLWCQLQADITGIPVVVPKQEEAACLGAAIMGAVSMGLFDTYEIDGVNTEFEREYLPRKNVKLETKIRQFAYLYDASLKAQSL
ncbi:MAG: FGGY family carbohydrate kinase, partial [Sphaerochaeta sp.]